MNLQQPVTKSHLLPSKLTLNVDRQKVMIVLQLLCDEGDSHSLLYISVFY